MENTKYAVDKESIDIVVENILEFLDNPEITHTDRLIAQGKLEAYNSLKLYPTYQDNQWNK